MTIYLTDGQATALKKWVESCHLPDCWLRLEASAEGGQKVHVLIPNPNGDSLPPAAAGVRRVKKKG